MTILNREVIAGKWHQIVGRAKVKWGKLTDDEILKTKGGAEELAGLVQERYGKTRERAKKEVEAFLDGCCPK